MLFKKVNFNFIPVAIFILIITGGITSPQSSLAEISLDSYCQITIQSMKQEVANYEALITIVNQYGNDLESLKQQEAIRRAELDKEREALYKLYGTTAEEYALYMGKNGQAVNKYLEENSLTKILIDDYSQQVKSLMDQYEALRESVMDSAPLL